MEEKNLLPEATAEYLDVVRDSSGAKNMLTYASIFIDKCTHTERESKSETSHLLSWTSHYCMLHMDAPLVISPGHPLDLAHSISA